jgi:pimeloyl-ACP methyl ester carboxylesterase
VFLLLHGFTDAPSQFATVGQHLFDRGDNVYIPRLPHHAVRQSPVRALGQVRAPDLIRFGDSVLALAEGLGDSVIVVGLSAGGTIAAKMAQERASVRRAVLISPALAAASITKGASAALSVAGMVLPNVERSGSPDTTRPEYTKGITSRGLAHILLLGGMVINEAVNGPAPRSPEITFLLNERDFTVSEEAALILAQRWLEHDRRVVVYRFPISQGLPHNVMAPSKEGGRPELVFPVVESLARGEAPTGGARRLGVPCRGSGCRVRP